SVSWLPTGRCMDPPAGCALVGGNWNPGSRSGPSAVRRDQSALAAGVVVQLRGYGAAAGAFQRAGERGPVRRRRPAALAFAAPRRNGGERRLDLGGACL